MSRSHFRKIFGDIRARKGRTLLAALSIFVGVFGVVTLFTANDLITGTIREEIRPEEWPTQFIFAVLPNPAGVDNQAALDTITDLDGVVSAEGRLTQSMLWRLPDDEFMRDGTLEASWEAPDETAIMPLTLVEGTYPVAGENQIAVERRLAERHGLTLGDDLVIQTLGGETPAEETWTISAIIYQTYPSFASTTPMDSHLFAAFEDAQYITGVPGLSSFLVRHEDFAIADANPNLVRDAINQQTPYISALSIVDDPENNLIFQGMNSYVGIISALAITAMVVAGFLVVNIVNAVVVEQKKQIAVMKSFGATAWGNMVMYAGIALVYGIIGMIPGVILGIFAGYAMTEATAPLIQIYIPGFSVSISAVLLGIVMGVLVPLVAAFVPVMNGIRVNILEAMTDLGISGDYGTGPLARLIKNLPLPNVIKQALSNVNRKKWRLMLTGLTLTLAAASFMGVLGMVLFLQDRIDEIFNLDGTGYNISIALSQPATVDEIAPLILDVDGVNGVFGEFETSLLVEGYADDFGGNEVPMRGVNPSDDLFAITLLEGEGWANDPTRDGIILANEVASQLDLGAGDTLTYIVNGETYDIDVIGVRDGTPSMMLSETLATQAGFVAADGTPLPNAIRVVLENFDATAEEAGDAINAIRANLMDAGINANYVNIVQQIEEGSSIIVALGGIFGTTAVVIAAIGAIGLLAALSMAVFERQKEIGVMRSIGAKSSTIISQFLFEGITVSLLSWIVAIPFALVFAQMLVNIITAGGLGDFVFPSASLLLGLVGILLIAFVASIGPSLSAARKTVSEIIRYQ